MIANYGKVFNHYDRDQLGQFLTETYVEVQEKVDGSQFSMAVIDGVLTCHSKNKQINLSDPGMFSKAVETAQMLQAHGELEPGVIYRCEYLSKEKHNTLTYQRAPKNWLVLFDVQKENGDYLEHIDLEFVARNLGIDIAPTIYSGPFGEMPSHDDLIERQSFLGGTAVEGVVIKCRTKRSQYDERMLKIKIVSDSFRERHTKDWKERNPGHLELIADIAASLRTESRYRKAVQNLRDRGELTETLKDIGPLMKILNTDLDEEETEYIKDRLFDFFRKQILRGVTKEFPQWYKEQLEGLVHND